MIEDTSLKSVTIPAYPPSTFARERVETTTTTRADGTPAAAMGPLEFATYRSRWRASARFRLHTAKVEAEREHDRLIRKAEEEARAAAERAMRIEGLDPPLLRKPEASD